VIYQTKGQAISGASFLPYPEASTAARINQQVDPHLERRIVSRSICCPTREIEWFEGRHDRFASTMANPENTWCGLDRRLQGICVTRPRVGLHASVDSDQDPDVVNKLKEGTKESIEYGLDWYADRLPLSTGNKKRANRSSSLSISEKGSIQQAQLSFGPKGGHLVTLLFDLSNLPREVVYTKPTLVYTALGRNHEWRSKTFKTSPEDRAVFAR
jgi:hypothetical protein